MNTITAESLGSVEFKRDYNLRYAYAAGAMYKGIASKELVVKMGRAGMISFLGAGGLSMERLEADIQFIQRELGGDFAYGMNLLHQPATPQMEEDTVDLFLKYGVHNVEAAAYMQMTPALVRFRLQGLERDGNEIRIKNRVIGKVSRPEVATAFMSPAPERIVEKLLEAGTITAAQAELSKTTPMADDLCVEADSGGHTDQGVAYALTPAILNLRDEMMKQYGYARRVRVGAAGGIGTPQAAAAAFIMGADFILTGSINQCTVEAGTSDAVKDMLVGLDVQDTDYAPAGDMFELGARVQVVRKGVFFPARANKLYDLYRQYNSLDEIDEKTRKQIQERYFKRSFEDVYRETKEYLLRRHPEEVEKAEKNPKTKMAQIFKWYFTHTTRLAMNGSSDQKVDYQVHCGPALGSFNRWVKGTELEDWRNRHVDDIAMRLLHGTADWLNERIRALGGGG